jgi:hypothetical protein
MLWVVDALRLQAAFQVEQSYNGRRQIERSVVQLIGDFDLEIVTLSSVGIRINLQDQPHRYCLVCLDYWTRKCTEGESRTGAWVRSRLDNIPEIIHEHSRARVSIWGYFFVDYEKISLGPYREGQCTRENGNEEEKAAKLKHRE